jgi:hypothetical protein
MTTRLQRRKEASSKNSPLITTPLRIPLTHTHTHTPFSYNLHPSANHSPSLKFLPKISSAIVLPGSPILQRGLTVTVFYLEAHPRHSSFDHLTMRRCTRHDTNVSYGEHMVPAPPFLTPSPSVSRPSRTGVQTSNHSQSAPVCMRLLVYTLNENDITQHQLHS